MAALSFKHTNAVRFDADLFLLLHETSKKSRLRRKKRMLQMTEDVCVSIRNKPLGYGEKNLARLFARFFVVVW